MNLKGIVDHTLPGVWSMISDSHVRHPLKLGLKELQGAEWVEDKQTSKEKK